MPPSFSLLLTDSIFANHHGHASQEWSGSSWVLSQDLRLGFLNEQITILAFSYLDVHMNGLGT